MQKLSIHGGMPLSGEVRVAGAKNAALPILAAALLTAEPMRITNVPQLNDVGTMIALLKRMGVVAASDSHGSVDLDASRVAEPFAPYLVAMGARIRGAGTDVISIQGVDTLKGVAHAVMPDRIEAGTFLAAAAATRGRITLTEAPVAALEAILERLREAGGAIETSERTVTLAMPWRPRAVSVRTAPFPGFPTDMQAQFIALNAVAEGTAFVTETIFENRFMHVQELRRLGAQIEVEGNTALVHGVERLAGATVMATDLRASASLVIAGLAADGGTVIDRIYHLDRGY